MRPHTADELSEDTDISELCMVEMGMIVDLVLKAGLVGTCMARAGLIEECAVEIDVDELCVLEDGVTDGYLVKAIELYLVGMDTFEHDMAKAHAIEGGMAKSIEENMVKQNAGTIWESMMAKVFDGSMVKQNASERDMVKPNVTESNSLLYGCKLW